MDLKNMGERAQTFEEWLRRPVYVVQCRTWKIAERLGLCVYGVRSLPGYRNAATQRARDLVALSVRMERLQQRLVESAAMAN